MEAYRMDNDDRFEDKLEEKINKLLERKGVSRRSFLKFCGAMAATLGLEATYLPKIAEALGYSSPNAPAARRHFSALRAHSSTTCC
jgi:hypothetical protein